MKDKVYMGSMTSVLGEKKDLNQYSNLVGEKALQNVFYEDGFQYYYTTDSTHAEMCLTAVQQVIKQANLESTAIDLIIYASSTVEATDSEELDDLLIKSGFATTYATGLSGAACGSLGHAMDTGLMFMAGRSEIRNIIVVCVNKCPGAWPRNYYNNTCLLSDGATACLLSKDLEGLEVIDCKYQFDRRIRQAVSTGTIEGNMQSMKMMAKHATNIKERMLLSAGISSEDIQQVIPNYSGYSWQEIYAGVLDVETEKVSIIGLQEIAHMFSGEQLINLKMYLSRSEGSAVQDGYILMLFTSENGVGMMMLKRGN